MASSVSGMLGDIVRQLNDAFGQALGGDSARSGDPAPNLHVDVKIGQPGGVVPLTCPKCGASVQQGDGAVSFCAYCGSQLHADDGSAKVTYATVDETRIRELEIEEARERRQMEIEEKRRPGRVKLSIVLGGAGFLMMIVGWFAGSGSGDSNSAWYMVATTGFCFLMVVAYIWLIAFQGSRDNDRGADVSDELRSTSEIHQGLNKDLVSVTGPDDFIIGGHIAALLNSQVSCRNVARSGGHAN